MHLLLAILRHIHRELYLLGPGVVPIVLSKYRSACALIVAILCCAVALYDVSRRRWVQAGCWVAAAALLYAGFQADSKLWNPRASIALGSAAIAAAVLAVLLTFWEILENALAKARRERHQLRQVPGAPPRPSPRPPA